MRRRRRCVSDSLSESAGSGLSSDESDLSEGERGRLSEEEQDRLTPRFHEYNAAVVCKGWNNVLLLYRQHCLDRLLLHT